MTTADEGGTDPVKRIAPDLGRHGWPATFLVITGRGHEDGVLHAGRVAYLDRIGTDIGPHTVDLVRPARLRAPEPDGRSSSGRGRGRG